MYDETRLDENQKRKSRSIPASVVFGPIIGSSIGQLAGLLYGEMVWGMIIGFSIGVVGGLLWGMSKKS